MKINFIIIHNIGNNLIKIKYNVRFRFKRKINYKIVHKISKQLIKMKSEVRFRFGT